MASVTDPDFLDALTKTDLLEGGDSDNREDKGGFTRKGLIQSDIDEYCELKGLPKFSVRECDEAKRQTIFHALYWERPDLNLLPAPLSFIVYQFGVNFYPASVIRDICDKFGLPQKGRINSEIATVMTACGIEKACQMVLDAQVAKYIRAIQRSNKALTAWLEGPKTEARPKDQRAFGPGWINRCKRASVLAAIRWSPAPDSILFVNRHHAGYKAQFPPEA